MFSHAQNLLNRLISMVQKHQTIPHFFKIYKGLLFQIYAWIYTYIYSDQNYLKVSKFGKYQSSPLFLKLFFAHLSSFYSPIAKL